MSVTAWFRRQRRAARLRKLRRIVRDNAMCGGMLVLAMSRDNCGMYPTAGALETAVQRHERTCPKCSACIEAEREIAELRREEAA